MAESPLIAKPPSGLLGRLAKLPIVFYRLGLGGLLGEGLIVLNHIGRKTGAIHQAARQGQGPFWGINLAEADDAGLQAVVRDKVPMFGLVVQS